MVQNASLLRRFAVLWLGAVLSAAAQMSHRAWTTENGLPQNSVHALRQTRDGFLWIGTEKGLARFDGVKFVNYTRENSPGLGSDDVRALWEGSGSLEIATADGAFLLTQGRFSQSGQMHPAIPEQLRLPEVVLRKLPAGDRVQAAMVDSRGVVWVGTRRGLFQQKGDDLEAVEEFGNDTVECMIHDREGNIWVGAGATGLHEFSPRSIEMVPAFRNRAITTLAAGDGELWAGTQEDGLLRSTRGGVDAITMAQGLSSNVVSALGRGADGKIFVGSPDGVNVLEKTRPQTSLRLEDGLPDNFIRSILPAPDGPLWIGTRRGLARWDNGRVTVLDHAAGLASDLVGSLLRASNGDLWIGTLHGISRLRSGKVENFKPDDAATSLLEDVKGRIWLGTATTGLYLWDGTSFRSVEAKAVPKRIFGLVDDVRRELWLRTHTGLARVSADDAARCVTESKCGLPVRVFDTGDGLASDDIFDLGHPGQLRDKDGVLYFATRRGVARIDPASIQGNAAAPLPAITHVAVDNGEREIDSARGIEVHPADRRVTIAYAAPSFRQPAKVHYKYFLDGFDRDWVDADTNRTVSYTNLPAGKHRFLVMAANEDGVWSTIPAELAIIVSPPLYRRWWFYVLAAAALALCIFVLYRLRERRLKARFASVLSERSRIAREIHDTLAQDLAGVSVQLELVSSLMKSDRERAAAQIEEAKAVVRDGLANARRSIWDLRATSDSADVQTLPVRARSVSEATAGREGVIHFETTGAYRPLAPRVEEEVLAILKEAVRNAMLHSSADAVYVSLAYQGETLKMAVRDEGRGFDTASPVAAGHFGLRGIYERAEAIKAHVSIESAQGKGSCVTLLVDF